MHLFRFIIVTSEGKSMFIRSSIGKLGVCSGELAFAKIMKNIFYFSTRRSNKIPGFVICFCKSNW